MPGRITWLSSTSLPPVPGSRSPLSAGPPRVPLCGSAKILTLRSSTDSVISSPSEATNSAAIPASSTSGPGTSTRNPCTARSPPLLKAISASKKALYSPPHPPPPPPSHENQVCYPAHQQVGRYTSRTYRTRADILGVSLFVEYLQLMSCQNSVITDRAAPQPGQTGQNGYAGPGRRQEARKSPDARRGQPGVEG